MASSRGYQTQSGWVVGLASFAAFVLILSGTFQFFEGLAAVIKDDLYIVGSQYAYNLDVSAWGWIHMLWGVIVIIAGYGILTGQTWARILGMAAAGLSALAQFFYIQYDPVWSVLIIALDIAVIWALTQYRDPDVAA